LRGGQKNQADSRGESHHRPAIFWVRIDIFKAELIGPGGLLLQ